MKNVIIPVFLLAAIGASHAAQSLKQDYKCYAELVDGTYGIVRLSRVDMTLQEIKQQAADLTAPSLEHQKDLPVAEVLECQAWDQSFVIYDAAEAEKTLTW